MRVQEPNENKNKNHWNRVTSQCVNSINKEHFVNVYFKFSIGIRSIKIKSREQGRAGERSMGQGKGRESTAA